MRGETGEYRERDNLVAIGDEDSCFGEETVAGKHVDEVMASGRRKAGGPLQISRNERRRSRNGDWVNASELEVDDVLRRTVVANESGETILVWGG